jgi:HPt (histidine-containing phosphotransfer) domain-containing protein
MSNQSIESNAAVEFVWSPDLMITRLGGDEELARQLVTLFIEECPRMMAQVRESVAEGTPDLVRRAAHAFKGSVSNFTAEGPTVTAFALENIGREARLDDASVLLAQLEREVEILMMQLRAFDATAPSEASASQADC